MGISLIWLLLKFNDPQCNGFNGKRRRTGAGAKPPENFWLTSVQSKESNLFDTKRALQKGALSFFCLKGQGSRPPGPP